MPKRHIRQLHFLFERIKLTKQGRLSQYLKEIKQYPILGKEEEFRLARKIRKSRDENALNHFVCSNLRIVVTIAKRYENRGLPLLDLINAGNEGLIHAAQKFDDRKGVRFYWYGQWWIRRAIQNAIATDRSIVPKSYLAKRIQSITSKLIKKKGREPTTRELAKILKVDEHKVSLAQTELLPTYSLDRISEHLDQDTTVDEEDLAFEAEHFDFEHDEHLISPAIDKIHVKQKRKAMLEKAVNMLERRHREIIKRNFGLGDYDVHSLEEISRIMNITRERVRQIKENALRNLKTIISSRRKRMKK
ncbi:RNA polymerase sigma factor SigA [subsurface metagenome]